MNDILEPKLRSDLRTEIKKLLQLTVDLNLLSERSFHAGFSGHCQLLELRVFVSEKHFDREIFRKDISMKVNQKAELTYRISKLQSKIATCHAAAAKLKNLALAKPVDSTSATSIQKA